MKELQLMSLEEIYEYAKNMKNIDEQASLNAFIYAAEKGHTPSQVSLGDIYSLGEIIEQDYDKSFYYYLKAADQGDELAQIEAGKYYLCGLNEWDAAYRMFKRAADQGHTSAFVWLGDCFNYGYGVSSNFDESVKWYQKAADLGDEYAKNKLEELYANESYIRCKFGDVAGALRMYLPSAEHGSSYAQYMLGLCYEKLGDCLKAFQWYLKAAEQQELDAQIALARFYENGLSVEKDEQKSKFWYLQSLKLYLNDTYAMNTKDYNELINWCLKQAEQGDVDAQYYIGLKYSYSDDRLHEASFWLEKASKQGHLEAEKLLYDMFPIEENYSDEDDIPF